MRLKTILTVGVVFFLVMASAWANTDERVWTFKSGEKIRAAQLSYDESSGEIVLLVDDEDLITVQINELSPIDQAWLIEWNQIEEEMDMLISTLGGQFEHHVAEGEYTTDFYAYYPSVYETDPKRPMLILFNAGGNAVRYLKLFVDAAEQLGIITVACAEFYNTKSGSGHGADMLKRFEELLPIIEANIPHDPARLFMGGNSGGAMRAYNYTAKIDRPWAGVYANGGWLGGPEFYDWSYPSGMRIAMVNGNNDHAANRWIESDSKVLGSCGNQAVLFSFDGGHQAAPPKSRLKALTWLINENGDYN